MLHEREEPYANANRVSSVSGLGQGAAVKTPAGNWRQGAPWWVMPLAIPGVIFGAIGFAFSIFLQLSIVTFQFVVILVAGIVFLAIGEYGWGIGALAFVALHACGGCIGAANERQRRGLPEDGRVSQRPLTRSLHRESDSPIPRG